MQMVQIDRRHVLKGVAATAVATAAGTAVPGPADAGHKPPAAADLARFDTPGDRDFPKVGGNLGNQNYSSLRRVDRGNVGHLRGAWLNRIEGGITEGNNE